MRTVSAKISTYGKAPAKYGRNAWKVALGSRPFLLYAGWTHVGSGRSYEYLIPPNGSTGRDPTIDIQVPSDDEILSIALRMHAGHKSCLEVIEGFVVMYQASGEVEFQIVETMTFAPGRWGEKSGPQPPSIRKNTSLSFGVGAPWSVTIVWDRGDDEPPTLLRN